MENPAAAGLGVLSLLFFVGLLAGWLGALACQIASWRRSSGERRQQLKWLMSGAAVCGAVRSPPRSRSTASLWEVLMLGIIALPVSIGIGILKYRLYDIDRIISRTLAYALVTGLLVGVYAGLVLLATAGAAGSPRRWRWRRPRWPPRRCSTRYAAGCSASWTGGSTGPATTRTPPWTPSPPGPRAPWPCPSSGPTCSAVIGQALEPAHLAVWLADGER